MNNTTLHATPYGVTARMMWGCSQFPWTCYGTPHGSNRVIPILCVLRVSVVTKAATWVRYFSDDRKRRSRQAPRRPTRHDGAEQRGSIEVSFHQAYGTTFITGSVGLWLVSYQPFNLIDVVFCHQITARLEVKTSDIRIFRFIDQIIQPDIDLSPLTGCNGAI